ncbi:MAG TPA: FAD:protein FMN transferase [Rariglobus sp.]|jgi:thiamine biosynthesis lipoprotein|nr:FAD:protein FMN transferase [Rariglobus sp.]
MKPPSPIPEPVLRRARPLLGTFVEIRASGLPASRLERAVEKAFAAIVRVQALMSFHEPTSDLSRLNRLAVRRAVRVDAATWTVLRQAIIMARASAGCFDPSIAPVLQRHGLLLGQPTVSRADWHAIRLLPGRRVRFLAPLTLDLGGIAKGYAVDRAVSTLRRAGVSCGLVNAGGDLRVFGIQSAPVHVRHPSRPGAFFPLGELHEGALATSAPTYVNALIDPRDDTICARGISITVLAPTALLADVLTKVVAVDPAAAPRLLARHRARAVILDTQGRTVWLDAASFRHVA